MPVWMILICIGLLGGVTAGLFGIGAWLGARLANGLNEAYLHLGFGLFVCCLGIFRVYRAGRNFGYY